MKISHHYYCLNRLLFTALFLITFFLPFIQTQGVAAGLESLSFENSVNPSVYRNYFNSRETEFTKGFSHQSISLNTSRINDTGADQIYPVPYWRTWWAVTIYTIILILIIIMYIRCKSKSYQKTEKSTKDFNTELQQQIDHREKAEKINQTLFRISNAIITTSNLNELYQSIHNALGVIIDVTNFYIALYDEGRESITLSHIVDEIDAFDDYIPSFTKTNSLIGNVILEKKPVFLNREKLVKLETEKRILGTRPEIWLGVPLIISNNVIGVMAVYSYNNPHQFTENDLNILGSVSEQIAVAIERKKADEERVRLGTAIEQATEAFIITNQNGIIDYVNPAFENITGYLKNETIGRNVGILGGEQGNTFLNESKKVIETGNTWSGKLSFNKKHNMPFTAIVTISPVRDASGSILNIVSIIRDISREDQLEDQLRRSQKLESIGTLAGGIAHDFNNILSAIIGYTQIAGLKVKKDSETTNCLNKVLKASQRAKDLINQILSFSREQEHEKQPVKISIIINEALKLLRPSLPSTIKIHSELERNRDTVEADSSQIHQILMNLCTNAHHAMKDKGGTLSINLSAVELDSAQASVFSELEPGPYLKLTVSDTGTGIDEEILDKIFDPYFSTKEKGEGTGLGLAVVHGIVKSHGGSISVESKSNQGTSIHIYFPQIVEETGTKGDEPNDTYPVGNECILFIDDEAYLTDISKQMLEHIGYKTIARTSSVEALELFKTRFNEIDCVITDLTMPNMTGDKLAKELIKIRPDIPIILCSGYSERITPEKASNIGIKDFLKKPLSMRDLSITLRRVLDENKNE